MNQSNNPIRAHDVPNLRTDQLAPHSIESEEAVLGAILINPDSLDEVHFLQADDFFIVRHAWIFETVRALQNAKTPIDVVTVAQRLEERGHLAEIGGAAYVLSLINKTPSALNVEGYGRIVERMALRRRLIEAASQIARLAHSDETDTERVIELAEKAIHTVSERQAVTISTVKSAQELIAEDLHQVQKWHDDPQEIRGMRCGIYPLDLAMGGWEPGRNYLVAGPPGVGKSALLAQMAGGFAAQGHPVLFFALEMPGLEVLRRIVCQRANVSSQLLRQGKLKPDDLDRYKKEAAEVAKLPLWFEDRAGLSLHGMQSLARRYRRERGIEVCFIDTLQKVADIGRGSSLYEGTTNVSVGIANWARNSDYSVVTAAQLSRASGQRKDKRPVLSDLRDSGSQEQDADGVFMLYRESYYPKPSKGSAKPVPGEVIEIILRKNRYGEANFPVEMWWNPTWPGFARLTKEPVNLDKIAGEIADIKRHPATASSGNGKAPAEPPTDSLEAAKQRIKEKEQQGKLPTFVAGPPLLDEADEIADIKRRRAEAETKTDTENSK